jgi:Trypsin-like peptidase domain
VQSFIIAILLSLLLPSYSRANYLTGADQLKAVGASFSWPEVRSKSLKIILEYKSDGEWKRTNLGSGFLISPDGLFVTAYHVMTYCLQPQRKESRFSQAIDCSTANPRIRYKAQNGDREFELQIVSHLKEEDSTNGKNIHTPDEIIKHRDFVIGRLKAEDKVRFPYWELRDFEAGKISLGNPRADFELKPLLPPKQVFIAGYPEDGNFEVAHGFLNLTDENNRGYFAIDSRVYRRSYLVTAGLAPDLQWGIGVENHMSGGAVLDSSGYPVGIIVNGNQRTAGVLSIENILETFFSRHREADVQPAVVLTPTKTPLYLRRKPH